MRPISRVKKGFTLIELVVVAPLIILLIGGMVAVTVQATTSALRANARAVLQNDILGALDMIEQDIRLSQSISAQYAGPNTSRLDMDNFATNVNPMDPNRKLIRKSDCAAVGSSGIDPRQAVTYWRYYGISGNSFVRQANFSGKWCDSGQAATESAVWQRHGVTETLIDNVELTMSTTPETLASRPNSASAMTIVLTGKRHVAGQEISYTGRLYAKSSNVAGS